MFSLKICRKCSSDKPKYSAFVSSGSHYPAPRFPGRGTISINGYTIGHSAYIFWKLTVETKPDYPTIIHQKFTK